MLNLIYSSPERGATDYIQNKISELVKENKRCFLFTPESAVLSMEQRMFSAMEPSANLFFEVLSFRRLPDRLQRHCGGLNKGYVTEQGRAMLTHLALMDCGNLLVKYSSLARNPDFAISLSEQIAKMKSMAFTPEMLSEAASKAKISGLENTANKLSDISVVYANYDELLHRELCDMGDRLFYAAKRLKDVHFFENSHVFVCGFSGFTPTEFEILEEILPFCEELTVSVPCKKDEESDIFEKPKNMAHTLKRLAAKKGVKVSVPQDVSKEIEHSEFRLLHHGLWDENAEKEPCQRVYTLSADDTNKEVQAAAKIILSLCKDGYKMRDIAICAAETEHYGSELEAIFAKYKIPLFMSAKTKFSELSLCKLVNASISAVENGFYYEDMLGVLKSSLSNVSEELSDALELYVKTWSISGALWSEDYEFDLNPDGFSDRMTRRTERILKDCNEAKRALARPLYDLKERLSLGTNASDYAVALFEYLSELDVEKKLENSAQFAEQNGDLLLGDLIKRLYKSFVELLEQCVDICKDRKISVSEFQTLLDLGMKSLSLQVIPTSIDEVNLISPQTLFGNSPKVLIILGAEEGVFPRNEAEDSFFTREELKIFDSLGLDLGTYKDSFAYEPLREFQCAVSLPEQRLYVLHSKEKNTSIGFKRIERLLDVKNLSENELPLVGIEALADAYAQSKDEKLAEILRNTAPDMYEKMNKSIFSVEEKINPETARMIIGQDFETSPSAVEEYFSCKLRCWGNRILHFREDKEAKLNEANIGSYIHAIAERFINEFLISGRSFLSLKKEELDELVKQFAQEYTSDVFGGIESKSERFKYLIGRIENAVKLFLKYLMENLAQSEFVPWKTELFIGKGNYKGLSVQCENGKISVMGKSDRVDIYRKNGKSYIRIVDYKSSAKQISPDLVEQGFNLQMLMYLFSLCDNAKDEEGNELLPAGVIYQPTKFSKMKLDSFEAKEDFCKEYRNSGLLLCDEDVLRAMDKELSGRYIPVKTDPKTGEIKLSDSLVSLEEMGKLSQTLKGLLQTMYAELRAGDACAKPKDHSKGEACKYCNLKSLCRYEKNYESGEEND